jgi:hypothetical protein
METCKGMESKAEGNPEESSHSVEWILLLVNISIDIGQSIRIKSY